MIQRIITALILAPLVIWGIFQLPLSLFAVALAIVTFIGLWEWTQFIPSSFSRYALLLPSVIISAVFFVLMLPQFVAKIDASHTALKVAEVIQNLLTGDSNVFYILLVIGALWWFFACGLVITFIKSRVNWENSSVLSHLFCVLTLLPFFWSVFFLRTVEYNVDPYYGSRLVLFVCFIVWAADSGAYFVGKRFGKNKLAPAVSPNKTIEGLLGGITTALIVALLVVKWFDLHFASYTVMITITLITVVISVFGDLVESMFKRVSNIKDSGTIIPGHGGILDRIDSLTAAFPIFAFLYFTF